MNSAERKRIRLIIRQVHPDLFTNNPYERQCNSESLKSLNSFIDDLAKGRSPRPTRVEFYVRDGQELRKVEAQLNPRGGVAPLLYAFGLISETELRANADAAPSAVDTNFLAWLRDQVQDAVRTADKHDVLKWHIRRLKNTLEERFLLASVQAGAEYAVSIAEQEQQVEALKILEAGLVTSLDKLKSPNVFEGLTVQLYHPAACPQEAHSFVDDNGNFNMATSYIKSFVGDDGAIHVVADRATIRDQILSLDLAKARMLAEVNYFWLKRVRDLTPIVQQLLGVRSVWVDTKTESNAQKFVLWAGYLVEQKEEIRQLLRGKAFSFSIIVHSDPVGPMINFHASSPIVNVRADTPPHHLLQFLVSEGGLAASAAANEVHSTRAKEEALLERVRQVFEAKCVIKICMNDKVAEGAMRMLENADTIKAAVDLRGACIALDDCYEVWDSGFISIPYDFKITELSSMVKSLQAGTRPATPDTAPPPAPASNGNGNGNGAAATGGHAGAYAAAADGVAGGGFGGDRAAAGSGARETVVASAARGGAERRPAPVRAPPPASVRGSTGRFVQRMVRVPRTVIGRAAATATRTALSQRPCKTTAMRW